MSALVNVAFFAFASPRLQRRTGTVIFVAGWIPRTAAQFMCMCPLQSQYRFQGPARFTAEAFPEEVLLTSV